MVTREKEMYGTFCRIEGKLEEVTDQIAEAKPMLLEHAQQASDEQGIDLDLDNVEWIIRQAYHNEEGTFLSDESFEGAIPYVTVAWKAQAHG